ncbi:MAG: hypothetical protein QOI73_2400 [Solirubrobacteraceae bacterium]|nr:hypothetical protein [Solirubrobacteraceae bacterium]
MRSDQIRLAIGQLQALVDQRLPERFYRSEPRWRTALTGLMARIAGISGSIARLAEPEHVADALTLLRSLYDHTVLFAWLSISPEERVERWHEAARQQRLAMGADAQDNLGVPLFGDEDLEGARGERGIPEHVAERAAEADVYWSERIAGLHTATDAKHHMLSLRGLYTVIFRMGSRTTHGSLDSIDYCADNDRGRLIVHSQTAPNLMWPALAVPLFAIALVIASERLGWPDAEKARMINEAFGANDD